MKTIITLSLFAFALSFNSLYAQEPEIKIKKGVVKVDGKDCLKSQTTGGNFTISDLSGNELIFLQYYQESETQPAYTKIIFLQEKKIVTNHSGFFSRKALVKKLISGKVLTNCTLNSDQIDMFVLKYNEEIPTKQVVNINVNN